MPADECGLTALLILPFGGFLRRFPGGQLLRQRLAAVIRPRSQRLAPDEPRDSPEQVLRFRDASTAFFLRLNRPQMDAASSALSLYPGSVPVYLHLPAEKMTLLAPKTGWCDASDGCLNRLNALLGAENVKLLESR